MDRGAWRATVHGVTKSWTQLSVHAKTMWGVWKPPSRNAQHLGLQGLCCLCCLCEHRGCGCQVL